MRREAILGMVSEKELEEKEYYRRRLQQWKALGFDTRELEVMLETDFPRLKEMKFDKLREQLTLMTSEESIPDLRPKEPVIKKRSHRIEVPHIREVEDIRNEKEDQREDHLEDIRAEMSRRKRSEDMRVHDLAGEFDDRPKRSSDDHEDYPLISFSRSTDELPKRNVLEDRPSQRGAKDEMELLDEEAAIIRKKRMLLEAEEARLHRKKRILAEIEEDDHEPSDMDIGQEDYDDENSDLSKDEPALIFVGRGREEEDEDEDEEEEGEEDDQATIKVDHRPKRTRSDEDQDDIDELLEEAEEVEEEDEDEDDEEEPRPKKRKKRRRAAAVVPVPKRRKRPVPKKVRKRPVPKKVRKKVRRKGYKSDDNQQKYAFAFVFVIIIIIASIAGFMYMTPTLTAKINVDKTSVTIGESIDFDGTGSKGSGEIDLYKWDFGDGTIVRGATASHVYDTAGDFNVKLTVRDESGSKRTQTVKISVSELQVALPSKMIGDDGLYDVDGLIHFENEKDGLISFDNPIQPGAQIKVVSIDMHYFGTMTSNIKGISSEEDGFNEVHQTLHREVVQDLDFEGDAYTNIGSAPVEIDGTVDLRQQVYVDLNTNHSVKTVTSATTETEPIRISGIQVSPKMTSQDDLRTYPDLATVGNQVNIEDLFVQRTLDTGDPNTLQGQIQKGTPPDVVTYSWKYDGVDEVYDRPAVHLNVTLDSNTLSKLSLSVFFVDIWVSNDIPTYVKIHTYLEGSNGTTDYKADSTATMRSFTPGQSAITGTCGAQHYHPLHPDALFEPFNKTPPEGAANKTSHLFTPHTAMVEAMNQSTAFNTFMNSGSPYAVAGNYSEKNGPTWNLTFGSKGSTRGYNIIVTWIGSAYSVIATEEDIDSPSISRDEFVSMLTFETAERIFKADAKVNGELFSGGMVDYQTTTLYLDAVTPYPNLDFTLTSISATEVPYTYTLAKQVGDKVFSVSINAQNGQLMFIQEHTGDLPIMDILFGDG